MYYGRDGMRYRRWQSLERVAVDERRELRAKEKAGDRPGAAVDFSGSDASSTTPRNRANELNPNNRLYLGDGKGR